jgi:hypothetical protein
MFSKDQCGAIPATPAPRTDGEKISVFSLFAVASSPKQVILGVIVA